MTLRVALTGNVASGKSAVAQVWQEAGVPVVSADGLSREAVAPGSAGLDEVRAAFGDGVIALDGSLDRAALRARVFGDDAERKRLEAILHPRIRQLRDAWILRREAEGVPLLVAEIPLLFETGTQGDFDVTVLVDAPEPVRLERMLRERGISASEARAIMAAQMDASAKRALADVIIANHGSLEELRSRALEVMTELRGRSQTPLVKLDLHLHTAGSWDCLSDPEEVLERALAKGFHRIAITDHNRVRVARAMHERHPQRIIPGEEVKTREGVDVIGLYVSEEIPKGTPALETVERIRAQGGIPYLPHPFAGGKGGGGRMADELAAVCDVVEVFNARLHPERLNGAALELAERHRKLHGAGSDAHTLGELGGAFVEVPSHPNTPDGLRSALTSARTGGRTASYLVHLASTWAKVRKRLPGPPELVGD